MLQSVTANSDVMLAAVPAFLGNLWSIAQIVIGFSLIVFVHELGHFFAAKWAGVRVERFAVGFGKELFGFTKGETRYSFNVLPLGGYVKMLGQEDFVVDKTGELKVKEDPRSFTNKSVGKRMVIVCAGVVMNLVFAAVAFMIVTMIGRMKMPAVIGFVDENMPAGRAGLQPGDRILAINGETVDDFEQLTRIVSLSNEGEELVFKVERNGHIVEPPPRVIPEYQTDKERRQIGIGPGWNSRVDYLPQGDESRPDRLHVNDEITAVIINGKRVPIDKEGWLPLVRHLYASMGKPMQLVVKRPVHPDKLTEAEALSSNPRIETVEKVVTFQPDWLPGPFNPDTPEYASLLGFVPRLSMLHAFQKEPFSDAGMQYGDVVVGIADIEFPSWPELTSAYEKNAGKTIPLRVRRRYAANHGLSADAVRWLVAHRETLITNAIKDFGNAKQSAATLVETSKLDDADRKAVVAELDPLSDLKAWRQWLDNVDVIELSLKVPEPSLLSSDGVKVQAYLRPMDEDLVFVDDTIPTFGNEPTPARGTGIPRFSVIESVNNEPVASWRDFYVSLRDHAGQTVKIAYRHFDTLGTAEMNVPACVESALGLNRGDRITKIAGKSEAEIVVGKDSNGEPIKSRTILPDWRAIAALLKANVGKTVEVEYAKLSGERGKGEYAVTPNNIDPWLDRVQYSLPVSLYPLSERHPVHNPIKALVAGVEQTYGATADTVRTIKQLITRNVGTKNMSGPLGILSIGAKVAHQSTLDLIWLLGWLSANLAVINFLPLPIVDGGLFLLLVLEKIRGEPVSIKVQVATQIIGIALIATVFILVTAQDILKMVS